MSDVGQSTYRWYVLALSAATFTFVAALPFSCMPVLFKEISEDLGLSLVQIGTVWGMASLAGVFVSLFAGLLGDRFGVKLVLGVSCLLIGMTGALRGLSDSFLTLTVTVFLLGIVRTIVTINVTKTVGIWFKGRKLGMANGVISMGMGIGLMLGPMISATVLSPLLGDWRNVLFLYGALSVAISVLWFLFGREPRRVETTNGYSGAVQIRQALSKLIHLKALWLLGITLAFRMGCIMGITGYLPLYLRELGWSASNADGTLAAFYAVSTMGVIPLSLLSDRLGSRKAILFPALMVTFIAIGLLPVVEGVAIWIIMILAGIFMDGFMAMIITMVMETDGVDPAYAGTALGMVFTIAQIAGVVSPPIGNSFANINIGSPFLFWAILSIGALVTLIFSKETGWRRVKAISGA